MTNQDDNTLSVINPEDRNACEITNITVGSHPTGVLYVPNSKSIYIANSWSNTISVIKPNTHKIEDNSCRDNQIKSIQVGINPTNIQIDAKNNVGYVANSLSNSISIINLNSTDPSMNVKEIGVGLSPDAVAVDSSKHTVYVANQDNNNVSVLVFSNTTTLQSNKTIQVGKSPSSVAIDSHTGNVYVSNQADDTISVINGTNYAVNTIAVGKSPIAVAVDPDLRSGYVVNQADETVSMFNLTNPSQTITIPVGSLPTSVL